jgi:hypothetical protein
MALSTHRNLLFLHGFQHGGLRFGWGSIDFVCKNQVGKDRALDELEFTGSGEFIFLDDFRSRDVRRHQVRGELNPGKGHPHTFRQGGYHKRLGQARHPFQQAMAARKDGHEQLLDHLILPDDDLGHFRAHTLGRLFDIIHFLHVTGGRCLLFIHVKSPSY